MSNEKRQTSAKIAAAAAMALPLTGCITVEPPERPIEINLNVDIRQEVLVRLAEDVEEIIRENPDAFPAQPDL